MERIPLALEVGLRDDLFKYPSHSDTIHTLRTAYPGYNGTLKVDSVEEALEIVPNNSDITCVFANGMQNDINVRRLGAILRLEKFRGLLLLARPEDGANSYLQVLIDSLAVPKLEGVYNTLVYDPTSDLFSPKDSPLQIASGIKTTVLVPGKLISYACENGHLMSQNS